MINICTNLIAKPLKLGIFLSFEVHCRKPCLTETGKFKTKLFKFPLKNLAMYSRESQKMQIFCTSTVYTSCSQVQLLDPLNFLIIKPTFEISPEIIF